MCTMHAVFMMGMVLVCSELHAMRGTPFRFGAINVEDSLQEARSGTIKEIRRPVAFLNHMLRIARNARQYKKNRYEVVRAVFSGKDPNVFLASALYNQDYYLIEFLLNRGADANAILDLQGTRKPALFHAQYDTVATLLLEHGADLNIHDSEGTILHEVMKPSYSLELVGHYLSLAIDADHVDRDSGAVLDVNNSDNESGDTPLHALIKYGVDSNVSATLRHARSKIISLLRAHADVSIPNAEGKTALDLLHKKEIPHNARGAKLRCALITLLSSAADECSICLNTARCSTRLLLSCNHLFHAACVKRWFVQQKILRWEWRKKAGAKTCPYCCTAVMNELPI